MIGAGESIVFDWEPQMSSAAELITSPRGLDSRFDPNTRRTTNERRQRYHERMDAKAALRAEDERERLATRGAREDAAADHRRRSRRGSGVTRTDPVRSCPRRRGSS